jgi:hypothetical protein
LCFFGFRCGDNVLGNWFAETTPKPKRPAKKKAGGDCPSATCYLSLWHSLMTADGNAVESHPGDEAELAQLRERGLVRGKKWIRFTDHGLKLRDAISFR